LRWGRSEERTATQMDVGRCGEVKQTRTGKKANSNGRKDNEPFDLKRNQREKIKESVYFVSVLSST
jgi:hypothetical protein